MMTKLRQTGMSYRQIVAELAKRGISTMRRRMDRSHRSQRAAAFKLSIWPMAITSLTEVSCGLEG
jgi:hypothetical protein